MELEKRQTIRSIYRHEIRIKVNTLAFGNDKMESISPHILQISQHPIYQQTEIGFETFVLLVFFI